MSILGHFDYTVKVASKITEQTENLSTDHIFNLMNTLKITLKQVNENYFYSVISERHWQYLNDPEWMRYIQH
jgi:hypothetical protein